MSKAVPKPQETVEPAKNALPITAILGAVVVVLLVAGGAAWYFLRPKPEPQTPSTPVASAPAPAQAPEPQAVPVPTDQTAGPASPAPSRPQAARAAKPAPAPAPPPPSPTVSPEQAKAASLDNLAREAYAKGNYAEPVETSALAYAKQALAVSSSDDYARRLLEDSVHGGTYQVQQAIAAKDFATARRVAGVMAQLLPNRKDVVGLKEDIASAERSQEAARRPPPVVPLESFRVYHMHTEKAPADKGPYCSGTLSVVSGRVKYVAESATDNQIHSFDFACGDIREVKTNSRVAARQGGFHLRTSNTNLNFVPADPNSAPVPGLTSACGK